METVDLRRPWYTKAAFAAAVTGLGLFLLTGQSMSMRIFSSILILDIFAFCSALLGLIHKKELKHQLLIICLSLAPWLVILVFLLLVFILRPPLAP